MQTTAVLSSKYFQYAYTIYNVLLQHTIFMINDLTFVIVKLVVEQ